MTAGANAAPSNAVSDEAIRSALLSPDAAVQALAWVSLPRDDRSDDQVRAWHQTWITERPDGKTKALLARHACARPGVWQRLCTEMDLWKDWIAHEPGNAQPWMLLAWQAQQNDDTVALQAALDRVARSDHIDTGTRQDLLLARRLSSTVMGGDAPAGELAIHAFGVWLAMVQPMQTYTAVCPTGRGQAIRPDRADLCRQVSGWMIEGREGSMGVAQIGYSIAMAYAESDESRRQLAQERDQLRALQDAFVADERLHFERDDIFPDYADDYLQLIVEHGERQAMIDWLASGPDAQKQP
ncbi:MAG: hypothetical protein KDI37_11400 [Xanthomonadales bacterium]|nr:hypothetical protein [Xanthomonadales bacterium]